MFQFAKWDAGKATDRDILQSIVGESSETLTFLFGTVSRGDLVQLSETMKDDVMPAPLKSGTQVSVASRIEQAATAGAGAEDHGKVVLNASDVGKLIVVTIADYMDQAVEASLTTLSHHTPPGETLLEDTDGLLRPPL